MLMSRYILYLSSTLALNLIIMRNPSSRISCVMDGNNLSNDQIFGLVAAGLITGGQSCSYLVQEWTEINQDGLHGYVKDPQNWIDAPTFGTQLIILILQYSNAFQCDDDDLISNPAFCVALAFVVVYISVVAGSSMCIGRRWTDGNTEDHNKASRRIWTETYSSRIGILVFGLALLVMLCMWRKKELDGGDRFYYAQLANIVSANTILM